MVHDGGCYYNHRKPIKPEQNDAYTVNSISSFRICQGLRVFAPMLIRYLYLIKLIVKRMTVLQYGCTKSGKCVVLKPEHIREPFLLWPFQIILCS